MDKATILEVEASLEKLKWKDIVAIDRTVAKGDRAESFENKDGVRVLRVRRDEVKINV